jgi:hypothetical protein
LQVGPRCLQISLRSDKVLQTLSRELYVLAAKYQVPLLVSACEQAILAYVLETTTVVSLIQFADIYGTQSLQNSTLRYFGQNFEAVMKSEEYKSLSDEEKEVLKKKMTEGMKSSQKKKIEKCIATSASSRFSICLIM